MLQIVFHRIASAGVGTNGQTELALVRMKIHDVLLCTLANVLLIIGPLCNCERDDAFIGYKEKKTDACIDTNSNCEKWSKGVLSQCIENAYYMRHYCRKVSVKFPLQDPLPLLQQLSQCPLHYSSADTSTPVYWPRSPVRSRHSAARMTTCRPGKAMRRRRVPASSPQCSLEPMQQRSTTFAGTQIWGHTMSQVAHSLHEHAPAGTHRVLWEADASLAGILYAVQAKTCAGHPGCI